MRSCPECRQQFPDTEEFCPHHGVKLLQLASYAAGAVTAMAAPALPPQIATIIQHGFGIPVAEQYDRLVGTVLDGRYYLEEKLGEGGMGVVFKAHHTVIEKTVAIKILKRDVARDRSVVQRFVQEAKAASRIGHPGIVNVTDFGTLPDGSAFSVMEYIEGPTLAKIIKDGPLKRARALPIAGQIARALAAAHEKGIVHRDLKPENIFLVTRDGHHDIVKVCDFGIAKFAPVGTLDGPRLTRAGAVFGTPEYMAPEQAAGRSDNDHRVNVYALGTILYEMLVGRVPHKGETVVATLAQQMLDPIILPRQMNSKADINDKLEHVIMTALAKDRDKRYGSMGDLWVALEAAAGGIQLEVAGSSSGRTAAQSYPSGRTTSEIAKYATASSGRTPSVYPLGPATVRDARPSEILSAAKAAAFRARSRRLVIGVLGTTIVAVAALAVAFAVRKPGSGKQNPVVLLGADAGALVAHGGADAGRHTAGGPPDAGVIAHVVPDAAPRVVLNPPDAGVIAPRIESVVVVTTRPAGGQLFISGELVGNDGMRLHRPRGSRLTVRCVLPRYEIGEVYVNFENEAGEAVCKMKKEAICDPNLKDPFGNCPGQPG